MQTFSLCTKKKKNRNEFRSQQQGRLDGMLGTLHTPSRCGYVEPARIPTRGVCRWAHRRWPTGRPNDRIYATLRWSFNNWPLTLVPLNAGRCYSVWPLDLIACNIVSCFNAFPQSFQINHCAVSQGRPSTRKSIMSLPGHPSPCLRPADQQRLLPPNRDSALGDQSPGPPGEACVQSLSRRMQIEETSC